MKRSKTQLGSRHIYQSELGTETMTDVCSVKMTAVNKGSLCAYLGFALVFAGNLFAGFYDEVKLRAEQGDPEAQE